MKGKLVYLLEDDPDILHMLTILLSRNGYQVGAFDNAQSFIKEMKSATPDLCVLDINLPDGNGIDISHDLGEGAYTSQVPVVLMSAQPYQHELFNYSGAWKFVSKPFDIDYFMKTVASLV